MDSPGEHGCVVWFGEPGRNEHQALLKAGWAVRVTTAGSCGGVGVRNDSAVVAVADLRRASAESVAELAGLLANNPEVPWITLVSPQTPAHEDDIRLILEASFDFFSEPLDMARLVAALAQIKGEQPALAPPEIDGIISTHDGPMREVVTNLRKYAPVNLPVLITGETGTGKERAACALHALSDRGDKPFVAINCGAMVPNLVQSELFGHERGAFTGANSRRIGHIESAVGGSVFLDEVGDLPLDAQTNLLRFLQEGTIERVGSSQLIRVDVRVLAATHVDLEQAVAEGRFREDLYYRLNVLRLAMPPLRDRGKDIELLAEHFLAGFRERHDVRACAFGSMARRAMRNHGWPGNVRELVNRVQRAAVVAEDRLISAADLDLAGAASAGQGTYLERTRGTAEREAILQCLRESRFNVSECARRLRISRVTVYRLCKKHQLALSDMR